MPNKNDQTTIWVSGRRKTAVARIRLSKGKGDFILGDNKDLSSYFPLEIDQVRLVEPFKVSGRDVKGFDVSIRFLGGGKKSQLEAAILGLAKALVVSDKNLRPLLKEAGFLTRDPRMKERKKYGLKRARKAPQYSKR